MAVPNQTAHQRAVVLDDDGSHLLLVILVLRDESASWVYLSCGILVGIYHARIVVYHVVRLVVDEPLLVGSLEFGQQGKLAPLCVPVVGVVARLLDVKSG